MLTLIKDKLTCIKAGWRENFIFTFVKFSNKITSEIGAAAAMKFCGILLLLVLVPIICGAPAPQLLEGTFLNSSYK